MPSLGKMIRDFGSAMLRSAKEGFPPVPKLIYLSRRNRCERCTDKGRCPHCGCVLWLKCSMATEKCPLGHWDEYKNEPHGEYDQKIREREK